MGKASLSSALGFVSSDKRRLQRSLAQVTDKYTFIRLRSVLMVALGHSADAVATMMGRSVQMIYRWIKTYVKGHDPSSLLTKARSGRPQTAPRITDNRILKELRANPLALGYKVTSWTVLTLAYRLSQRYDCPITPVTLYRRMRQMGLEYKRPKYFYEQKDPNRAQKRGNCPKAKTDAGFSRSAL